MDDRREDWRHGVDENLASLNAGQRVWERDLGGIRKLLGDIDKLLRGDPEKDTDGLMARLHLQENDLNLLKAVILKDKAGNKGLVSRVEALESGDRRSDRWLKVWIAVIGLISGILVAAASNVDRLEAFWRRKSADPVDQMIERVKHPKGKHRHGVLRPAPLQETESDD